MMRRLPPIAFVLLAALLSACGDEKSASSTAAKPGPHGLPHIHGLGIDPRDRALYVATHSGLFRAADGDRRLQLVGELRHDLMGFTLARTDRYLASGHPAPEDRGQPAVLGLLESRDRGRSWTPVSLYGRADFHALEASGNRVYGFDASQGRLMVSPDWGRRWEEHRPPAPVYDLAVSAGDADLVVASTELGVFASRTAGRDWRLLDGDTAGLLAWPQANRLYLVTGDGEFRLSTDGGGTWQTIGNVGDEPVAFAAREHDLYVAFSDGTVKRSSDMGRSWTLRAAS
jgi:hypothetical protein